MTADGLFLTRKGEGQDGLPIISGKSCINSQLRRVGSLFRGMVATETWNLNSNVSILCISQDVPFSRIEAHCGNSHEPNSISIGVRFHDSFELPGQR